MMEIKSKEARDCFVVNFVQFVSAPQSHTKRLRKLRKTLELCPSNLSEIQWMKMWRGFYYAVWYAEMRKGGEEMIQEIAENNNPSFLLSGFMAMTKDWGGIDAFRIDKYMYLVRHMLRNVLQKQVSALQSNQLLFEKEIKKFSNMNSENLSNIETKLIEEEKAIQPHVNIKANAIDFILATTHFSVGLFIHISDIYLQEVETILDKMDSTEKVQLYPDLLLPFAKWLSLVPDVRLLKSIKNIFYSFFKETLCQERTEIKLEILSNIEQPMKVIASHTASAKRRNVVYSIVDEIIKTKHNLKTNSKCIKRKPVSIDRRTKKVKYELVATTPFVRSLVPLPVG